MQPVGPTGVGTCWWDGSNAPPCVCTSIGELEDLYSTFDDVVDPRSTTSFISADVVDPVQPEVLS